MAGPSTTVFVMFSLTLIFAIFHCNATEQPQINLNSEFRRQTYLRPIVELIKSREIRIPSVDVDSLAQQPPIKRERPIFHDWTSCEFSPMSCLLRRRRQVY